MWWTVRWTAWRILNSLSTLNSEPHSLRRSAFVVAFQCPLTLSIQMVSMRKCFALPWHWVISVPATLWTGERMLCLSNELTIHRFFVWLFLEEECLYLIIIYTYGTVFCQLSFKLCLFIHVWCVYWHMNICFNYINRVIIDSYRQNGHRQNTNETCKMASKIFASFPLYSAKSVLVQGLCRAVSFKTYMTEFLAQPIFSHKTSRPIHDNM